MKTIYTTLFSLLIIATEALAQEPQKLSLQDCMDYALKHNYSVKNAKLDALIQEAQNNQTLSAALPHINGKAEFDRFYVPQTQFADASSFDKTGETPKGVYIAPLQFTLPYGSSATVTGSQILFDGSVAVALKARKAILEFARLNGEVTEENVRYNIYKAYNSLVIAYRQYDILKSSLSFARVMEHDATVLRKNGFGEKIDVERASVAVNNLESDSIKVSNVLTISEQILKFQMGMDLKTSILLTDTVLATRRQLAIDLLATDADYEHVPEYRLTQKAVTLNEYNVKRYKMAALPSLSTFWAYGWNYGQFEFEKMFKFPHYEVNSTIGLQLNLPIFNGFMRKYQLTEAKLNVEKAKNSMENMKLTIDFQRDQARTNMKNALLQVQSQSRNIDLSKDVLDLAQKKYKSGVGSNFEVTQAQTDQLSTQNNYFNALMDLINAEADLTKALGMLK